MDKLVYLFELDSRRNTAAECRLGQQALFEELVENGNRVVITFNQLTDSEAFLCTLRNAEAYESMLELVRMGAVRVSRYGAIRTASQYIQNSIEKCLESGSNAFLFSGIPVRCTERELLTELGEALRYSDPARMRERLARAQAAGDGAEVERLTYLVRYLELIFTLSMEPLSGNPPRDDKCATFTQFYARIRAACQAGEAVDEGLRPLMEGALAHLDGVEAGLAAEDPKDERRLRQNRTNWVNALDELPPGKELCMAEALIDLCYNYTLEESIRGVSKHYPDGEGEAGFRADLRRRLAAYWAQGEREEHQFCVGDRDQVIEYRGALPRWDMAVRLLRPLLEKGETAAPPTVPSVYEEDLRGEGRRWRLRLAGSMARQFAFTLVYVLLFVLINLGLGYLEDAFLGVMSAYAWTVVSLVGGVILFGLLGAVLERAMDMPDILESVKNMGVGCMDIWRLVTAPRDQAYHAEERERAG